MLNIDYLKPQKPVIFEHLENRVFRLLFHAYFYTLKGLGKFPLDFELTLYYY